ncbi:uncharacterized protein LOC144508204 [Mustelus asterias]
MGGRSSSTLDRTNNSDQKYQVECYGQGKIHEDIVKELNISKHEGRPGTPCILFVYKVSQENEDLRNALQWVTDKGAIRKEDIRFVFLLVKIPEKSKKMEVELRTEPELFHKETKVVRIHWNETRRLGSVCFSHTEVTQAVKETVKETINSWNRYHGGEDTVEESTAGNSEVKTENQSHGGGDTVNESTAGNLEVKTENQSHGGGDTVNESTAGNSEVKTENQSHGGEDTVEESTAGNTDEDRESESQ